MNNVNNVTVGKPRISGGIWRAPLGTPLPTDANSELSSAYKALGYVSEDGVSNENTADVESAVAWGGDHVLEVQTEKPDNFSFTLIEAMNTEVLKLVYGDENVSGNIEDGIVIKANAEEQEECALVIDMKLKGNVLKRICIPDAKVTEVGEITYNNSDPVGYETTVSCLPDGNGNTHYEYIVQSAKSSGEFTVSGKLAPTPTEADGVANNNKVTGVSAVNNNIVITVPVNDLTEFASSDPSQGTHKWIALGVGTGVDSIIGVSYNGEAFTTQDVADATAVGLGRGSFVLYIKADEVVSTSKTFTLDKDGYTQATVTVSINDTSN